MKTLRALLRPSVPYGQLIDNYPNRPREISQDILYLSSATARPLAHRIDINGGAAILGLDAEYILTDVECVYSWHKWKVLHSITIPQPTQSATIVLPDAVERFQRMELGPGGVEITTDERLSVAQIHFGAAAPNGFWVALSPVCFALIANGYLQGLFVILEP